MVARGVYRSHIYGDLPPAPIHAASMLKLLWGNMSMVMLQLKECMLVRHRRELSNEEVVADFHTYVEQLNIKCGELEGKIQRCNQRALLHKQKAAAEPSPHGKEREIRHAKLHLQDRHRLQEDQDRTLRFMHLIRQQIDSLTSSQMDNIMVEAMQQYNMSAKRMGLPDKSKEIEKLGSDIKERFQEVNELQTLLSDVADPTGTGLFQEADDDDLMLELEALGFDCETEPPQQRAPSPVGEQPPPILKKKVLIEELEEVQLEALAA